MPNTPKLRAFSKIFSYFQTKGVFIIETVLFLGFGGLLGVWLILQPDLPDPLMLFLLGLQFILFFAAGAYVFFFFLDFLYSITRTTSNKIQHVLTVGLFLVINVGLAVWSMWGVDVGLAPRVMELALQQKLAPSLVAVEIQDYENFGQSGYRLWAKTQVKIEVTLSDILPSVQANPDQFSLRRVGPLSFFTHNCFDGLNMANQEYVKLLFGQTFANPEQLLLAFSTPSGYSLLDRLKFFAQFDSVQVSSVKSGCPQLSVNDYDTKSHQFGPLWVMGSGQDTYRVLKYHDQETEYVTIINLPTLNELARYQGRRNTLTVFLSKSVESVFVLDGERQVLSWVRVGAENLEYPLPKGKDFRPLGPIGETGLFAASIDGQPTILGLMYDDKLEAPRYDVWRDTSYSSQH